VLLAGLLSTAFAAGAPVTLAPNLRDDTVPVPWSGPARRRGPGDTGPVVVFVNFDGETLNCDDDFAASNNSFLACPPNSLTDIPPFNPAGYTCGSVAGCKETIRSMLGALWSERWNIRFVLERPAEGDYEMAMVGGTFPGDVIGISPLDCGDANRNTVSFSFSNDIAGLPDPEQVLVTTISHELSHALGQCHNDNQASIMYPSVDSGGGAQDWSCGNEVDSCGCAGYDPYCPSDYFDAILGPAPPDTLDPVVQILTPLSGANVPPRFSVRASVHDDRTMDSVDITANAARAGSAEPVVSGQYEWDLPALHAGHARVCVVGRDHAGNEGRDCVNITVDPAATCVSGDCCCGDACCAELDPCDCAGRLPDGTDCSLDQDCRGGICADDPWDQESVTKCTESCAEDAECPAGMTCVPAGGRGRCWSYVTEEGIGRPCHIAADCPASLACAFPEACVDQPIPDGGVDPGPCLGQGFCSRACGQTPCPERYLCAEVGGDRVCRFAGVGAEVGGGCAVTVASRPPTGSLALLGLLALAFHRLGAPRRRGRRRVPAADPP
jgi:hypothetical protein